jgi:hypothetical protein
MLRHSQGFGGMGDFLPFTPGEPEPTDGAQGTWLSPDQVPAWDRESAADLISQPQNFGGLGAGKPVPRGDFVEGEIESASRMIRHRQQFGGMGDWIPMNPTGPEPADGGQGTWLSPSQVAPSARESDAALIAGPESFSLGLGGLGSHYPVGEFDLSPICDPQTGACIGYATPAEAEASIGRRFVGNSAPAHPQERLPAFYNHPQLGPWGVDPSTAYQYWWAQQAAMQRAGASAPLAIWGSPGFVKPTPPLPPSPLAQTAAFNPYNDAYPVPGASVERF